MARESHQKECLRPNFFTNGSQLVPYLNLIPITGNPSVAPGISFRVYNPFQIVGLASKDVAGGSPNGGVGSGVFLYGQPSVISGFDYEDFYSALAFANRSGTNQSGFVSFTDIDPNTPLYLYYMYQFLNDDRIPIEWLKSLQPAKEIHTFWVIEDAKIAAGATPGGDDLLTYQRMFQVIQNLIQHHDNRLWLPPGEYSVVDNGTNTDPYVASLVAIWNNLSAGGASDVYFMTCELRSIR